MTVLGKEAVTTQISGHEVDLYPMLSSVLYNASSRIVPVLAGTGEEVRINEQRPGGALAVRFAQLLRQDGHAPLLVWLRDLLRWHSCKLSSAPPRHHPEIWSLQARRLATAALHILCDAHQPVDEGKDVDDVGCSRSLLRRRPHYKTPPSCGIAMLLYMGSRLD